MKKFILLLALALASLVQAKAAEFYGADLCATNLVLTNPSPGSALGVTNLVSANYPVSGPWVSTKGTNGLTLALAVTPVSANSGSVNLVSTFAVAFDETMLKYPTATFSVTSSVPANASSATSSFLVSLPASDFAGAKYFKLVSLNYAGTNASLTVLRARAGGWQ